MFLFENKSDFVSCALTCKIAYIFAFFNTEIYSKVAQNELLQTKPSVVHFAGFKVGEKQTKVVVSL